MPENNTGRDIAPMTSAQVCQAYLSDWKMGQSRRLEDLLACVVPEERAQALRALIIIELRMRLQAGDKPNEKDYLRRFPEDLAIIAEVLEMFPIGASQDSQADLPGVPIEITGYGDEFLASLEIVRADLVGAKPGADLPKTDPSPIPKATPEYQSAIPKPISDHGSTQIPRIITLTTETLDFHSPEAIQDLASSGAHELKIKPVDSSETTPTQEPAKRGRRPFVKLMLDWATNSSSADGEPDPDTLFQRIMVKSGFLNIPLQTPKGPPKEILSRERGFGTTQEEPEAEGATDVAGKESSFLLLIIGAVVVVALAVFAAMFVMSPRIKPMNEIEPDTRTITPEKTVPAAERK